MLFNLEEISLDIEKIASQLIDVATEDVSPEQLPEIFDSFQYGSIPHILGHLETIEELLEDNATTNKTFDKTVNPQEAASASTLYSE